MRVELKKEKNEMKMNNVENYINTFTNNVNFFGVV